MSLPLPVCSWSKECQTPKAKHALMVSVLEHLPRCNDAAFAKDCVRAILETNAIHVQTPTEAVQWAIRMFCNSELYEIADSFLPMLCSATHVTKPLTPSQRETWVTELVASLPTLE